MHANRAIELKTMAAPALILALWQRVRLCVEPPQWPKRWRWSRKVRTTLTVRQQWRRLHVAGRYGVKYVCLDVFPTDAVPARRVTR